VSLLVLTSSSNGKRSSFSSLLIALAVADSLFLLVYLFDAAYMDALRVNKQRKTNESHPNYMLNQKDEEEPLLPVETPPNWYQQIFPLFLHPVKSACVSGCVYMVVAVAANRHRAICYPMLYRRVHC